MSTPTVFVTGCSSGVGLATETSGQVARLEPVFEALGSEPTSRDDPVVDALLAEVDEFDARTADDGLLDLQDDTLAEEQKTLRKLEGLAGDGDLRSLVGTLVGL